jgi:hypothetical protein
MVVRAVGIVGKRCDLSVARDFSPGKGVIGAGRGVRK